MPNYMIPAHNLGYLKEKLDRLNVKALKLNLPMITMKEVAVHKREDSDNPLIVRIYHEVEVKGLEPKIAGWQFLATIQHTPEGNIVRAIPSAEGEEIDTRPYRMVEATCEHCRLERNRKDTYLLSNGSLLKQVGRSCMRDFLGHGSPEAIASALEVWDALRRLFSDCEDEDLDGGCPDERFYALEHYMSYVAEAVKRIGWVSARDADEFRISTRMTVDCNFADIRSNDSKIRAAAFHPCDESKELAKAAIAWCRETFGKRDPHELNDYEFNLKTAIATDELLIRNCGIAASLIAVYKRHLEDVAKASAGGSNEWLGAEKAKLEGIETTLISVKAFPSYMGDTRYLHTFKDSLGNTIIWWTATDPWQEGGKYTIAGTVKKLSEYRGTKQTELTRVREFTPKAPRKPRAKKALATV